MNHLVKRAGRVGIGRWAERRVVEFPEGEAVKDCCWFMFVGGGRWWQGRREE